MAFLVSLCVLLPGCYENAWEKHVSKDELLKSNLVEAVKLQPELSTFLAILKKTGYDQVLESSTNFTVFAPANSAWSGIDTTNVDQLRKTIGSLIAYNTYFTENDNLYTSLKSVNGKNIYYNSETKTFNGAKITSADIRTANGVIHITDKVAERKDNIWEHLSLSTDNNQYKFIAGLNTRVMDMEKSVAVGVDAGGKLKYDTVWKNINNFLAKYPIDNEDSLYTYIVVENDSYNLLVDKYKNYFKMLTSEQTDSLTNFNVCQDYVFKGIVDISQADTLTNVDYVKMSVSDVEVTNVYNSSNGRIYYVKKCDIKLKNKIKPIIIEGEAYNRSANSAYVFTRYKRWARGERDIAVSCGETQSDTLYRRLTGVKDSVASKTYFVNSGLVSNIANFYVEYKAKVNSTNYDVYYVAYDDIADHFDPTYTNFGVYKIVQKLFISMPGASPLRWGITDNGFGVANNYLGETRCFVGQGKAGVQELTKLKQWNLIQTSQLVEAPVVPNADIMTVSRTGTMTMWLCNTARSNAASRQGLLFLDYIMLVPRINEE